jgi:hypothetical protein
MWWCSVYLLDRFSAKHDQGLLHLVIWTFPETALDKHQNDPTAVAAVMDFFGGEAVAAAPPQQIDTVHVNSSNSGRN